MLFASKAVQIRVPSRVHSESPGGPESGSRIHSGWPKSGSRIPDPAGSGSRIRVPDVPDLGPVLARVRIHSRVVPNPCPGSGSRIWVPSQVADLHWLAEYLRSLRHDRGAQGELASQRSPNLSGSCPPCLIARPITLAEPQQIVAVRFCAWRCTFR